MGLFSGSGPNLFSLLPGSDFASRFADGFFARTGGWARRDIAQTTIMVNTRLAQRRIEEALADRAPGPGLLPRIALIPDLHADPLLCPDLPASIAPLRRRLHLTWLVEAFLRSTRQAGEPVAAPSAALDLADELAFLIDQFHDEALSVDDLQGVVAESGLAAEAAGHWEKTLVFVDLVRRLWPAIRAEEAAGALDPRERQRAVIDHLVAEWALHPPPHPIIAAGSTGSVAATATLLAAIARLPRGAVVLPGFDPGIGPQIWDNAGPDHAYGPFWGVFQQLNVAPDSVSPWMDEQLSPRLSLLNQALRPAPVTDQWHAHAPSLLAEIDPAVANVTLIEADSQRREAEAIAVAIRHALETPDRLVTLVTPDAALARRVAAALGHFQIVPDDTLGQPLSQTPPGILLQLVLEVARGRASSVVLGGLLQHPLMQPGISRRRHLELARAYERQTLRAGALPTDGPLLPDWNGAEDEGRQWLSRITEPIAALANTLPTASLADLVRTLRTTVEQLTDPADGTGPGIWDDEAGEGLEQFFATLQQDSTAYGNDPVSEFGALLLGLLRGEQLRPKPRQPHPRVRFCGPREARLESGDLVILAGLNDGVWPEIPDAGPWLSRPMREALGLALPERSVGLSAHDFLNAACRPEVIFSRATKVQGSATIASRWLIRLETLLSGIGAGDAWARMRGRGEDLLAAGAMLGAPDQPVPRAPRPSPAPLAQHRPRRMSVTGIETLTRDAYAVYARQILRVMPLDPLHRLPDPRDRGIVLHRILERFVERTEPWPGREDAALVLAQVADEVLRQDVPWPENRRSWRARVNRFADWFLQCEEIRRATGSPAVTERSGSMLLNLPSGPFEVTAKADRIDRLATGGSAIYDYKSGAPSRKMVDAGFNQQLHLQAAILEAGGFDGLEAMTGERGAFIGLGGTATANKEVAVEDLSSQLAERIANLSALLEHFATDAPYLSHSRPQLTSFAGDYDHLARVGEWTLGAET